MQNEGGVYTIPCKVNGLDLKFILDTGASNVTISLTEALYMIKNGYLSNDDIFGSTFAQLANGEIIENTEILLREIEIGGLKLYNISAMIVHELEAPLLLGQSAISKLGTISLKGSELIIFTRENTIVSQNQKDKPLSTKIKQEIKIEYEKGILALDLNNTQQSINSFRFVIENSNDKDQIASSYGYLGVAYMLLDNSLESITMFEIACQMNHDQYCHQAAFNKGIVFEKEGNYRKALESYEDCISLKPKGLTTKILRGYNNLNYRSHYNIGMIYSVQYGDCNSAIKHYLESIQSYDEEALGKADWRIAAINNIAYCYYELGDYMKCIEYYKIILGSNKYNKDALVSICFAYDNLGDKEQAKKYCKMASELGDHRAKDFLENN